ncbi:MAG: hypothetical protein AB8G99_04625 [Planctomycetaceae bacterium]
MRLLLLPERELEPERLRELLPLDRDDRELDARLLDELLREELAPLLRDELPRFALLREPDREDPRIEFRDEFDREELPTLLLRDERLEVEPLRLEELRELAPEFRDELDRLEPRMLLLVDELLLRVEEPLVEDRFPDREDRPVVADDRLLPLPSMLDLLLLLPRPDERVLDPR